VCDSRSEQLRRREIERLIESIYSETNDLRRKALIASLAEAEASSAAEPAPDASQRRRMIEQIIELIYNETEPDSRTALVEILLEVETNAAPAPRPPGCSRRD